MDHPGCRAHSGSNREQWEAIAEGKDSAGSYENSKGTRIFVHKREYKIKVNLNSFVINIQYYTESVIIKIISVTVNFSSFCNMLPF